MPDLPARDRYCDDKGCAELPARAHLEAHAHWGCVSPEQMAKLIDAVLTETRGALLAEVDRLRFESEQRLGELLFWHFEYREAMDNYRGENWQVGQLRAQLDAAEALAGRYGARIVAASMAAAPRQAPDGGR